MGTQPGTLLTFWTETFFKDLSYVSWDVYQHSWPLPTNPVAYTSSQLTYSSIPIVTNNNVSRYFVPLGTKSFPPSTKNHWYRRIFMLLFSTT